VLDGVHILPFFPYSSDDGFSVIDYKQVDPPLGGWEDVARLEQRYRLMFDAVINHISRESSWFQGFLQGERPYTDFFIAVDPETDLSEVVRPRALPLLTRFETANGVKYVWTTFSDDQIDLNYANPRVAMAIIDVLLFYAEQGAQIIRLDAIAYLWKEIGTGCIHLAKTHEMVKLWRAVFDAVAPDVLLITETNVPHQENISYFGDYLPETGKTDEAQLVYNFTLAPLTLHAFLSGDATRLSQWAKTLQAPTGATFFNFIASHDGFGVRPAEGILGPAEMQALVDRTLAHGGQVGYRAIPMAARAFMS
jgi:sucrose phosphorylase